MVRLIIGCGHPKEHRTLIRCRDCVLEYGSTECITHRWVTEMVTFTEEEDFKASLNRPYIRYCEKKAAQATLQPWMFGHDHNDDNDGLPESTLEPRKAVLA